MLEDAPVRMKSWLQLIQEEQPILLGAIQAELADNPRTRKFFRVVIAYLDGRQHLITASESTSKTDPMRALGRHEEATDVLEIFEALIETAVNKEE